MADLSPEEINRRHGRATWTCWGCKAATGLHWHNGWSVAMCGNPACAGNYDAMCAEQLASEESARAYEEEVYGSARETISGGCRIWQCRGIRVER